MSLEIPRLTDLGCGVQEGRSKHGPQDHSCRGQCSQHSRVTHLSQLLLEYKTKFLITFLVAVIVGLGRTVIHIIRHLLITVRCDLNQGLDWLSEGIRCYLNQGLDWVSLNMRCDLNQGLDWLSKGIRC